MNTELDKLFLKGIDAGNTKVMANTVSLQNTPKAWRLGPRSGHACQGLSWQLGWTIQDVCPVET